MVIAIFNHGIFMSQDFAGFLSDYVSIGNMLYACLFNESESLWAIQEQLIEIVRSDPVETVNSLIDQ